LTTRRQLQVITHIFMYQQQVAKNCPVEAMCHWPQ